MFGVEPLTGAYGRDYSSLAAAQKDWDEGKDFRTASGQYCSKADFDRPMSVRYAKLKKKGTLK